MAGQMNQVNEHPIERHEQSEYTTQDKMTSLFGLFGLASVRFGQVRRQAWRAFSGSYNIQRRRTSNPTRNHDFERRL